MPTANSYRLRVINDKFGENFSTQCEINFTKIVVTNPGYNVNKTGCLAFSQQILCIIKIQ